MAITVNSAGRAHARSLINSGDVNTSGDWSFSAERANAILGDDNWSAYSKMFLAVDSAYANDVKEHYKYPFGKGGKVYRSGLIAIRQRAGQQGETDVFNAAGALLEMIDGESKSMNNLKAVSRNDNELRVSNYMVLFGGKDLVGEFFTPETEFKSSYTDLGVLYVDFEHGRDHDRFGNSHDNLLGIVDWKTARIDDTGIFVERILNRRSEYVLHLEKLIEAGIVGTSSEAVSSGVRKKSSGEIVSWPLMRDSLTVTPMEPRMVGENVLTAAKALAEMFPASKSLAMITGGTIVDRLPFIENMKNLSDAEQRLRDAGFSRSEATAFVSRVKRLGQGDPDGVKDLVEALKRRNEALVV